MILFGEAPAAVDLTTVLLQLAFYALFGVSVWRFIRRPGPLELSVMAVFGAFVSLFLLTFINYLAPAWSSLFRPWLIAMLFLQPVFVLRLIDQIQPVPLAFSRLVLLGAVGSTAAPLAPPRPPGAFPPAVPPFFIPATA